jgi:hypothetical protein
MVTVLPHPEKIRSRSTLLGGIEFTLKIKICLESSNKNYLSQFQVNFLLESINYFLNQINII